MLCTEKEKVYPLTVCICKCLNLETYIFMNRTECATVSVKNNLFVQEIKPPVITTLQQKLSLKTLDNSGQYGPYLSALFGSHTTTSIRKCVSHLFLFLVKKVLTINNRNIIGTWQKSYNNNYYSKTRSQMIT